MLPSRSISCLVAWLLLTGGSAQAQQEDIPWEEDRPTFIDAVEVRVVNVDVYVTDKKGDRVTGLTRDDFEVFEDGQPVAITNFYAVEAGRPRSRTVAVEVGPSEGAQAPTALEPPTAVEIPEDQRLHLVIYIDNYNIRPANRARALRDVRSFVRENVTKVDRVMVVTYDRSLHIRRSFSSDPSNLVEGLLEIGELNTFAGNVDSDRRRALSDIDDADTYGEGVLVARAYADSVYSDLQFTIDALREIVSSLGGVPGRKAILYVSDGIPMSVGEDVFQAVDERFPQQTARLEAFSYDVTSRFRELAAHANANRIAFYTVDARGLETSAGVSADERDFRVNSSIEIMRSANLRAPLHFMADETGGKAIIGTNAIASGLRDVATDFETYYSLGYRPAGSGSGRYHSIDVKVRGKGLTVRHREGYRDKSTEALMSEGALAALLYRIERNPLEARIAFEPPTIREGGRFLLPLLAKIPLGRVTLIPREGLHEGRIRLNVAVMDSRGELSPVQQQPTVTISIPDEELETARQQLYVYELELMVRPGLQWVAVGIRDELSGESSYVTETVQIGGAPPR